MSDSPTHTVGYEVKSKLEKVTHSYPMLSLNKTKSSSKLKEFIKNKEGLLMCKMDGLTILMVYEGGKLVLAETRGNGEIGEVITHNAKVFENILLSIGFNIVPFLRVDNSSDIEESIETLKEYAKKKQYPIDGLVMTYNDIRYGKLLGVTEHNPKHSIAFKFYEEETTVLKDSE